MKFHKTLTFDRFGKFTPAERMAMVASEFLRAKSAALQGDVWSVRQCYLRARELLGWVELSRDLLPSQASYVVKISREISWGKLSEKSPKGFQVKHTQKLYRQMMKMALNKNGELKRSIST